jgi:hypothetical protein
MTTLAMPLDPIADPLLSADRLAELPPLRHPELEAKAARMFSRAGDARRWIEACIAAWEEEGRIASLDAAQREALVADYLREREFMERRFLYEYQLGVIFGMFLAPVLLGFGILYLVSRQRQWRNRIVLSAIYRQAQDLRPAPITYSI